MNFYLEKEKRILGDEIDFEKTVSNLFKNEPKRKSLSDNCIDAVEKHLNNEVVSKEFVEMYG